MISASPQAFAHDIIVTGFLQSTPLALRFCLFCKVPAAIALRSSDQSFLTSRLNINLPLHAPATARAPQDLLCRHWHFVTPSLLSNPNIFCQIGNQLQVEGLAVSVVKCRMQLHRHISPTPSARRHCHPRSFAALAGGVVDAIAVSTPRHFLFHERCVG